MSEIYDTGELVKRNAIIAITGLIYAVPTVASTAGTLALPAVTAGANAHFPIFFTPAGIFTDFSALQ